MHSHDASQLKDIHRRLELLRSEMLKLEADSLPGEADVHPDHRASARNLLHYLALRRHDIRDLQEQLAAMGLSSLGAHRIARFQRPPRRDGRARAAGWKRRPATRTKRHGGTGRGPGRREKYRHASRTCPGRTAGAHHGDDAIGGRVRLCARTRPGGERNELHAHQLRARTASARAKIAQA